MKPLIGITCAYDNEKDRYYLSQAYAKGIEQAGGIPLLLPSLDRENLPRLLEVVDGLLFSGGDDVDPYYFGEEPLPGNGEITPERDFFEIELARQALKKGKPLLAICRGIQVVNIAAGGTIYQDIYSQLANPLKHSQKAPRWYPTHKIELKAGTKLAQILQSREVRVNSFHHQAVATVAPGFIISATAPDGMVEGIESTGHSFAIGVQCHPECLWEKDERFFRLFYSFVEAARRSRG